MPDHLEDLQIEISKAMNGQDYMQVRSLAAAPVNIVLIADKITVIDRRAKA